MPQIKRFVKLDNPAKIFRYLMISFLLGVAISSFILVDYSIIIIFFCLSLSGIIFFWNNKSKRFLFFGGVFIILGILRYQFSLPIISDKYIWFYNEEKVIFQGTVIAEADQRIDHTKLTIIVKNIIINKQEKIVAGKVLVKANIYPQYNYGDVLEISCRLKAPSPIEDFAYDRYLAKEDIYSVCYYPKIKIINKNQGNYFYAKIFQFKGYLQNIINQNLPEPQASLFSAIIIGARRGIPAELNEKFNITGTTHLIAISGFNISIVVVILMELALALFIARRQAFWQVSFILVLYLIIIGLPASALRAGVMGWLAILAKHVGRLNNSHQVIIFAAVVMVLVNPKILRDDGGFQLSFLAVLGLMYFQPIMSLWLKRLPSYFQIKENLETTLAAQIATTPLIVFSFGRFSLIAPIVNLLVLSAATYLTILGLVIVFLSLLFPPLSQYFFWPAYLFLIYIIKVVEFFAAWPLASINL